MLQQTLEAVRADLTAAEEPVAAGATDQAVRQAAERVRAALGADLPDAYGAFLRRHDGLDFDGIVFYATAPREGFWQGIVEANEAWRDAEENRELLVLGDDDMSLYSVDLDGRRPAKRDRVNGEVVETYETIDAMIDAALRTRL